MDGIRDFLILHYHATSGRSEPLWTHCRTMALPETLVIREQQYRRSGRLILDTDELFRDASWLAVLNGQGIVAQGYNPLADAIDSGMVGVNRGVISDPAAPFGGVKSSGLGSEGGSEGLEEYLTTKYIALTS